jgi:hypothetical protein
MSGNDFEHVMIFLLLCINAHEMALLFDEI